MGRECREVNVKVSLALSVLRIRFLRTEDPPLLFSTEKKTAMLYSGRTCACQLLFHHHASLLLFVLCCSSYVCFFVSFFVVLSSIIFLHTHSFDSLLHTWYGRGFGGGVGRKWKVRVEGVCPHPFLPSCASTYINRQTYSCSLSTSFEAPQRHTHAHTYAGRKRTVKNAPPTGVGNTCIADVKHTNMT